MHFPDLATEEADTTIIKEAHALKGQNVSTILLEGSVNGIYIAVPAALAIPVLKKTDKHNLKEFSP